ncbi:MAG: hypothetical protein ACM3WV_11295 [Bacillota bacterium]
MDGNRIFMAITPPCTGGWRLRNGLLHWILADPEGVEAASRIVHEGTGQVQFAVDLDRPRLWWPNGQGKPELYSAIVT